MPKRRVTGRCIGDGGGGGSGVDVEVKVGVDVEAGGLVGEVRSRYDTEDLRVDFVGVEVGGGSDADGFDEEGVMFVFVV